MCAVMSLEARAGQRHSTDAVLSRGAGVFELLMTPFSERVTLPLWDLLHDTVALMCPGTCYLRTQSPLREMGWGAEVGGN